MFLQLIRKWFTTKSTIGELYIDNKFECYILEDPVRADGVKIPGETAIPDGCHNIAITYSPKYKRDLPLIYNNDNYSLSDGKGVIFKGIRIHSGNYPKDTEGCLLPGKSKAKDNSAVWNSRIAFKELYKKMKEAEDNDKDIQIEIINDQE